MRRYTTALFNSEFINLILWNIAFRGHLFDGGFFVHAGVQVGFEVFFGREGEVGGGFLLAFHDDDVFAARLLG